MGSIDCKAAQKLEEDRESEADIASAAHFDALNTSHALFKSMTSRVISSKEDLLSAAQKTFSIPNEKNYDLYYAFLSTEVLPSLPLSHRSTTNNSEIIGSRNAKSKNKLINSRAELLQGTVSPSQNPKKLIMFNRPKTRTQAKRAPLNKLKLSIESPITKNIPSLNPSSSRETLKKGNKVTSELLSRKQSSKSNIGENATLLQIELRKRKSFCILKSHNKVQFDIISLFPAEIQILVFTFIIDQYRQVLCVSAAWYTSISYAFDSLFNHIESQLASKSYQKVAFRNSFTQSSIWDGDSTKRMRIDRIIQLELLPGSEGKTLTVAYTFCFINDKKNRYITQYKIDCKPKGNRTIWIHRSHNILTRKSSAYSVNIVPVCTSDIFEIAINYYTQRGLIDLSSIEWLEPTIENSVDLDLLEGFIIRHSKESKENFEDLNRICELEQMVSEWYDSKFYKITTSFVDLNMIDQYFIIERIEYGPIGVKACKIHLTAYHTGNLFNI